MQQAPARHALRRGVPFLASYIPLTFPSAGCESDSDISNLLQKQGTACANSFNEGFAGGGDSCRYRGQNVAKQLSLHMTAHARGAADPEPVGAFGSVFARLAEGSGSGVPFAKAPFEGQVAGEVGDFRAEA